MSSNGKFTAAVKSLKYKGMRALFKIHTILKSQKVQNPIVSLKLFESMVKPIFIIWLSGMGKLLYQLRIKRYTSFRQNSL